MKALKYRGSHKVAAEETKNPTIQAPNDAIVKVSSAAICGSDLHMYEGRTDIEEGRTLGHEIMGTIHEVGSGVQQLKVGDRVVLPFNIACGLCHNCMRGITGACLTMDEAMEGAAYGFAGMGPYEGGQADYVRVPYADFNALKLPGKPGDTYEDDFLMLADIFPTAWHATELAKVATGNTVAIYGAGPVGLLSVMSAKIKGASEIYCIDSVQSRLDKAAELGAVPIQYGGEGATPAEQISEIRKKNATLKAALRPGEEKRLEGVDCGIDAIGYQARNFKDPSTEESNQALQDLIELVIPTGAIGVIGAYLPVDPGAPTDDLKKGILKLPFGLLWAKALSVGTGQAPVKKYNVYLRDLIIAGKANPGTIVTHHAAIDDAPEFYKRFSDREAGIHKIVLTPGL